MSTTTPERTIALPQGDFSADPVHSTVGFDVEYMGIGLFSAGVATFTATLLDGRLEGTATIASLELKDENLRAHLLAPDFFDAARFPEVSFSTTSSDVHDDTVTFDGEITIRGVSHPATLVGSLVGPVTDPYGGVRYGLKLETEIDRTAYGITWNADMPDGSKALSESVRLRADLALVKTS